MTGLNDFQNKNKEKKIIIGPTCIKQFSWDACWDPLFKNVGIDFGCGYFYANVSKTC